MHFPTKTKKLGLLVGALLLVLPSVLFLLPSKSDAAALTNTYLRPYRLKAAQTAKMRLVFRTTTNAGATGVTVDMDGADSSGKWSASSGSVHAGAMTTDVATCAAELSVTGLPGSLTVTGAASHTITITGVTALSASTTYCVDFTNTDAVTNPTSTGGPSTNGEYHPTIVETGGATDSTTVAVRIIAEDSVVVTATVAPSFNFQFNNTTTDAFGNLSTGGSSTTGKTITLTTNATGGWIVWAKSANGVSKGSLTSVTTSHPITSSSSIGSAAHTLGTNTEDYGLAVTINTNVNNGTLSLDSAYNGAANGVGVLDSQNFRPIASATGTTTGDIINVLERAAINGATPAANDYTDTITFIGAGNF
ncbi:hypothetical protein KW803_00760 [Candidatus Saccharibacteria bacterium]|nr:hypothetical protein [Candidatus Saccharibacteria bacterium]